MDPFVVLINKPKGMTSFKVVSLVKKILKSKKAGHCGTLDPLATGVLPIFLNAATKAIPFLATKDKEYLAEFKLGLTTNTLDSTGIITSKTEKAVEFNAVEKELKKMSGEIFQTVPMFSAVKHHGKPIYQLARKGIEIAREKKLRTIYELQLKKFDEESLVGEFKIKCSSGTYVRQICADLGEQLHIGGILTKLIRISACGFKIKDCISVDELELLAEQNKAEEKLIPLENLFLNYEKINLKSEEEVKFLNGVMLKISGNFENGTKIAVHGSKFLGIAEAIQNELKIVRIFV